MQILRLLAAAALAMSLAGQSFHLPSNTPGTGTCDPLPFGTDTRYQVLIPPADLGGQPALVRGFAVAPCATGVQSFFRITLRMAHLAAGPLSTTFANNLAGGAVTVLDGNLFHWPLTADTWNEVDLQQPFAFNGRDHLVVDVVVQGVSTGFAGTRAATTHQCVYRTNYTGQATGVDGGRSAFKMRVITGDAGTQAFGLGCRGTLGVPLLGMHGRGVLGTQLVVSVTFSALAPTTATLFVGASSAGNLPFELTQLGAPGCFVYTWPIVTIGTGTHSPGVASVTLQVPGDARLTGLALYFQWLVRDRGGNALGYTTSNYGRARLGI